MGSGMFRHDGLEQGGFAAEALGRSFGDDGVNVHDEGGRIGDSEPGAVEAVPNGGRCELGDCFSGELPRKIGKAVAGYSGGNFAKIDFDQIRNSGTFAGNSGRWNRWAGKADEPADFLETAGAIELHRGSVLFDDFQDHRSAAERFCFSK